CWRAWRPQRPFGARRVRQESARPRVSAATKGKGRPPSAGWCHSPGRLQVLANIRPARRQACLFAAAFPLVPGVLRSRPDLCALFPWELAGGGARLPILGCIVTSSNERRAFAGYESHKPMLLTTQKQKTVGLSLRLTLTSRFLRAAMQTNRCPINMETANTIVSCRSSILSAMKSVPSFYVENFGCRATQADGAAIERQFQERGLVRADASTEAEFVVLNTCTVTAAADQDARAAIRRINRANPQARIIVTGCYAQRAPQEIAALPGVAQVIGNSHKHELAGLALRSMKDLSCASDFSSGSGKEKAQSQIGDAHELSPSFVRLASLSDNWEL